MAGWILRHTNDPAVILRLQPGTVKTLGRTSHADFILDAALISRVHCRLRTEPSDRLVVEDLDSTNGTLVNGVRVDRAVLKAGDVLSIGRVDLAVEPAD